ncbi:unannotated protein [freshwater metagenome]|uniref:Unannotated protein n=1 Tax=freshwater metagenome TaxID=449393 RepID=A0A6J6KI02_9ZZZZ
MHLQISQPTFNCGKAVFVDLELSAHGLERKQFKHLAEFKSIAHRIEQRSNCIGNLR